MTKFKVRYSVDKDSLIVKICAVLLGVSALLRLVGYWGFWSEESGFAAVRIFIPICCNILYAVIILCFGEKLFSLTAIPMVLWAVAFIAQSVMTEGIFKMLLCILLSIAVAAIYVGTVFGVIKSKWAILPTFGLPLLYHIFIKERAMLFGESKAVIDELLPELSVLLVLLTLVLITFVMKMNATPDGKETLCGEIAEEEPVMALPEKGETHEQKD